MREIKFRGYNGEKWLFGNLEIDYKTKQACISDNGFWRRPVRFDTVGQFTGLTDSDGKEIYEGDVVEFNEEWHDFNGNYCINILRGYIKYDSGEFVIATLKHGESVMCLLSTYVQGGAVIVIGNIYDNPELLEVEA